MADLVLPLPDRLLALIETRQWPLDDHDANAQNLNRIPCPPDWDPGNNLGIFLYPPPFRSVAELVREREFWTTYCAPTEIVFDLAIPIGDLGLGSDAPIILDYGVNRVAPQVSVLEWSKDSTGRHDNHWKVVAPNFDAFCERLELERIDWDAIRKRRAAAGKRRRPWWRIV